LFPKSIWESPLRGWRPCSAGSALVLVPELVSETSPSVLLHGRLVGPWVDELESHWRRMQATAGERRLAVDLSSVTGIDRAARYLLQLMLLRNVSLVGACIAIRASLDDEDTPTSELG
jgi:hypothetical protein